MLKNHAAEIDQLNEAHREQLQQLQMDTKQLIKQTVKSITEGHEDKLSTIKDEHCQTIEAMEAEHAKALQKARQESGKQHEDMKKRDIDLSAANKILKRQTEQGKASLKSKEKEIETQKDKYERMINDLIQNSK